jgi:hypothetical protein
VWTSLAIAISTIQEADRSAVTGDRRSIGRVSTAQVSKGRPSGSFKEDDADFVPGFVTDLVGKLFDGVRSKGRKIGNLIFNSAECSTAVRSVCGVCLISLIHIPAIGLYMEPEGWQVLAWSFLDADTSVRRNLLSSLSVVIQTETVPTRFLAIPALLANDPALSEPAKQCLSFALRRLRSTHSVLTHQALTEDNDELITLAEHYMPESVLPYLIYLLSYHPDFPSDANLETEDDKSKAKLILGCIQMLVSSLFGSVSSDSTSNNDTLSYLLKQVNTISRYFKDRLDPDNVGLHFAARLTIKYLNENIRTSDNVQIYPREILLPRELFARMRGEPHGLDTRENPEYDKDRAIMKSLENSEKVIENFLHAQKGGKLRLAISPVKPSHPVTKKAGASRPKRSAQLVGRDQDDTDPSGDEAVPLSRKQKTAKRKQRALSDDDGGASEEEGLSSQPIVSVSSRPVRSSRAAISYKEKEESEKEMLKWEKTLEKKSNETKKRKSVPDAVLAEDRTRVSTGNRTHTQTDTDNAGMEEFEKFLSASPSLSKSYRTSQGADSGSVKSGVKLSPNSWRAISQSTMISSSGSQPTNSARKVC